MAIATKNAQRPTVPAYHNTDSHSTLEAMQGVAIQKLDSNDLPRPGTTPSLKMAMTGETYTEVITAPPPPMCP